MLAGTEAILAAAMQGAIESEIASSCGASPVAPNCIDGLSSGIAISLIPHLVSNIQVNPGQTVTGVTGVGTPGGPLPIIAQPVTTPGTIS